MGSNPISSTRFQRNLTIFESGRSSKSVTLSENFRRTQFLRTTGFLFVSGSPALLRLRSLFLIDDNMRIGSASPLNFYRFRVGTFKASTKFLRRNSHPIAPATEKPHRATATTRPTTSVLSFSIGGRLAGWLLFQLVGLVAGVSGIQAANPCSSCPLVEKPKPKFGCCPEKKVRDGRLPAG